MTDPSSDAIPVRGWWDGLSSELSEGFTEETGSHTVVLVEIEVWRAWQVMASAGRCTTSYLFGRSEEQVILTSNPRPRTLMPGVNAGDGERPTSFSVILLLCVRKRQVDAPAGFKPVHLTIMVVNRVLARTSMLPARFHGLEPAPSSVYFFCRGQVNRTLIAAWAHPVVAATGEGRRGVGSLLRVIRNRDQRRRHRDRPLP